MVVSVCVLKDLLYTRFVVDGAMEFLGSKTRTQKESRRCSSDCT
jgi:hypothetical protein